MTTEDTQFTVGKTTFYQGENGSAYEIERRPRGASRGKPAPTFVSGQPFCESTAGRLVCFLRY
ncbi:hypothetical protein N5K35_12555 [Pseudomonas sp. GD03651]|jgi:hypothetical protein|uniref:hypothetical protein n=1 Tax=Pseudomonas TaxID=286 RepID=UPI00040372EB|nr:MULTISPECIES: hypothetical protein [Pseudomonas]EKT4451222.1 hypothetical protein [Pseudomonas putida]MDD2067422.1 hypothetical protein [Pseudomonas putida]MDH2184543.1 hypothetical protein [Pseudomonas sp. GD03651]HDS1741560.1 hypothetical protein [Pseudomonas putida]HDS1810694.1 hypothetical protein [Pseudomonas putida]